MYSKNSNEKDQLTWTLHYQKYKTSKSIYFFLYFYVMCCNAPQKIVFVSLQLSIEWINKWSFLFAQMEIFIPFSDFIAHKYLWFFMELNDFFFLPGKSILFIYEFIFLCFVIWYQITGMILAFLWALWWHENFIDLYIEHQKIAIWF